MKPAVVYGMVALGLVVAGCGDSASDKAAKLGAPKAGPAVASTTTTGARRTSGCPDGEVQMRVASRSAVPVGAGRWKVAIAYDMKNVSSRGVTVTKLKFGWWDGPSGGTLAGTTEAAPRPPTDIGSGQIQEFESGATLSSSEEPSGESVVDVAWADAALERRCPFPDGHPAPDSAPTSPSSPSRTSSTTIPIGETHPLSTFVNSPGASLPVDLKDFTFTKSPFLRNAEFANADYYATGLVVRREERSPTVNPLSGESSAVRVLVIDGKAGRENFKHGAGYDLVGEFNEIVAYGGDSGVSGLPRAGDIVRFQIDDYTYGWVSYLVPTNRQQVLDYIASCCGAESAAPIPGQ